MKLNAEKAGYELITTDAAGVRVAGSADARGGEPCVTALGPPPTPRWANALT